MLVTNREFLRHAMSSPSRFVLPNDMMKEVLKNGSMPTEKRE